MLPDSPSHPDTARQSQTEPQTESQFQPQSQAQSQTQGLGAVMAAVRQSVEPSDAGGALPVDPLEAHWTTRKLPPVERWNPASCGDIAIEIKANGEWWHEGQRIGRAPLVTLFSSVLWREGDDFFLKTPVEKMRIRVEDVPFQITEMRRLPHDTFPQLQLRTPQGDVVTVDEAHPLNFHSPHHEPESEQRLYVQLRPGIEACLSRSLFYSLIDQSELSTHEGQTELVIRSGDYRASWTL